MQAAALLAKEAAKNLDPKEMFKGQTDLYSQWDATGLPTHDNEGAPLAKSKQKKLKKDQDKQAKLFGSK